LTKKGKKTIFTLIPKALLTMSLLCSISKWQCKGSVSRQPICLFQRYLPFYSASEFKYQPMEEPPFIGNWAYFYLKTTTI